jgi:alpha-L-arabinofuranosidase
MIWVNSLNLSRTPNYYVQQMYSCNRGDVVLTTQLDAGPAKLFANAVLDEKTSEIILKVVNAGETETTVQVSLDGITKVASAAKSTVLAGNLTDENPVGEAVKIQPSESKVTLTSPQFAHVFPAHSFTVLRMKAK